MFAYIPEPGKLLRSRLDLVKDIHIHKKKNFFLSEPLQISKMNLSIKSSSGPEHNSAVPCTLVYEKIARMIYGIRIYSKAAWKGRCGTELEC